MITLTPVMPSPTSTPETLWMLVELQVGWSVHWLVVILFPGAKESYVKKCAFNYNYNSAIGVFGSNNIAVEDNVIFRFINNGIFDESRGTRLNRNLVTRGESVARIKSQSKNFEFFACINIKRGRETELRNNVMAGCSNAGLYTIGSPSDSPYRMSGNEAHGTAHGIHLSSAGVSRVSSGTVIFRLDMKFFPCYNFQICSSGISSPG